MPRPHSSHRGAVLAIVAVSLIPVLSVVALSLDGGALLDQRRHAQAVADASALAGAADLYNNYQTGAGVDTGGSAQASALATAAANGCNNGGASNSVAVNIPPSSGPFSGQAGYVEVNVQINSTRAFSNLFGSGDVPVVARAVARGQWKPLDAAILALNPVGPGLTGVGNASSVVTGRVVIDSSSSNATVSNGSNVLMTAPEFVVSGPTAPDEHFVGEKTIDAPPTPDPLAYLPPPSPGATIPGNGKYNKSETLEPGFYPDGIQASATGVVLTLNPGIYYLGSGGLSITGGAGVIGEGVMIYNAGTANQDKITITGTGEVSLSPMTTGIYRGILLFQNRANLEDVTVTGSGNMNITGTIYAPGAQLNVKGEGDLVGSQYIVYRVNITGNGVLNVNYDENNSVKTRIIQLVE